jgi:hypothetical protein
MPRLPHHRQGEHAAGAKSGAIDAPLQPAGTDQTRAPLRLGLPEALLHLSASQGFWDELHLPRPVLPGRLEAAGECGDLDGGSRLGG